MTNEQKQQLAHFNEAKRIAQTLGKGQYRRVMNANYAGLKTSDGRMYVIGDRLNEIQNPDAYFVIMEKWGEQPAREIFGNFSIMYK